VCDTHYDRDSDNVDFYCEKICSLDCTDCTEGEYDDYWSCTGCKNGTMSVPLRTDQSTTYYYCQSYCPTSWTCPTDGSPASTTINRGVIIEETFNDFADEWDTSSSGFKVVQGNAYPSYKRG
jgi:hypothetical protein